MKKLMTLMLGLAFLTNPSTGRPAIQRQIQDTPRAALQKAIAAP